MYYKNAMRSLGICVIFAILFPLNHELKAQIIDYSEIFWLYGQSTYGITFRKSDFTAELDSIQNPAFGIGGSAVATDPISGDLLFYGDRDLNDLNIWALLAIAVNLALAEKGPPELLVEMLVDTAQTCIQGDSHRIAMFVLGCA